jgi:CRP-like cAMP-binding protein
MADSKSLYDTNIQLLFSDSRVKKFPKNQIVFYQGDPLNSICLIIKGFVKAYTILDTGDTRTLFLLGPGDIFPIAFSTSLDWEKSDIKYFYQSLSDVEMQLTESNTFRQNIEHDTKLMNIYLSYMAATNAAIINQLEMMKTKGAINKVAFLLPYLANKLGQKTGTNTYQLNLKL